ncbi:Cysteine desulfurase [hydrothermal vent metagenome]|uniref:cysteine desulfurase n=1 Tax=hydrothermal vent metagenome TaxID=652676 RepID=A0A3B1DX38_9ZZZZ
MEKIYLDYASTTPVDPEVLQAMEPYFYENFGNVSSSHFFGRQASKSLEDARDVLAQFIGAQSQEVIFTSGATEANNQAIIGVARSLKSKGKHIIISSIEHPSVLAPVEYLVKEDGYSVTYLSVDQEGQVDPDEVRDSITEETILISVMVASNEIGVIQPVEEIGALAKEKNIYFHVDAVQAVGHVPVNVEDIHCDVLSLSAHKFYGPKGVGALYIRKGTKVLPFLLGGDQEYGLRASTQNVAGAVGLVKAIGICQEKMAGEMKQQSAWRDKLFTEVSRRIDRVVINGHRTRRLPNNVHFSFEKVQGESLLMSLDMVGFAASMGSACHSGAMEPSHVLRAIGLSDDLAFGALRVTLGRWTTEDHINRLLDELPNMITGLRI